MELYKLVMLIILVALAIPAIIFLVVDWVRACREAKEQEKGELDNEGV